MSTNKTFPHIAQRAATGHGPECELWCRCGEYTVAERGVRAWGSDCPSALREALAAEREALTGARLEIAVQEGRALAAERERDDARSVLHDIRRVLETSLSGWAEATTDHGQPEMGPSPSLLDGVAYAMRRIAELEAATPGPHITPALMHRIEALGFTPGSGEPVDWLIRDHLRLREALNDAEAAHGAAIAERDELAATLANERGEGEPPVIGWLSVRVYGGDGEFRPGWRRGDVVVARFDPEGPWHVYDVDGTMFSLVLDDDGSPVEAPTARAVMRAASEAPADVRRVRLP